MFAGSRLLLPVSTNFITALILTRDVHFNHLTIRILTDYYNKLNGLKRHFFQYA